MLSMTAAAASLVADLTSDAALPDSAGLRIETNPATRSLRMGLAPSPEPADEVVVAHGARLFLAPGTPDRLDGKVLGAEISEERRVFFLDG